MTTNDDVTTVEVRIPHETVHLEGELAVPGQATGLVLFAHGSGSSRHSPRNQFVARTIREAGVGTLLFDLLTSDEEAVDTYTRHLRFDMGLLARRLVAATMWTALEPLTQNLRFGYFGSSTGGGAALVAAAQLGSRIGAVVSRGGRPDLANGALERMHAPTLLVVGSLDPLVIELNEDAFARLRCEKKFELVHGASHLFDEPGTLVQVARLAADWFAWHLR